MSDLGDELRDTIDGAAAPITFEEVVNRTPPTTSRRAPWRTIAMAAVVVVALVVGAFVVTQLGDDGRGSKPHIAAPSVAVGDIDLAVLSTSFDADGARGPLGADTLDAVRAVPGVAAAEGAMQRFVDVSMPGQATPRYPPAPGASALDQLTASQRSAIAISWEEGVPVQFSAGGPPREPGDVAINQSLATLYGVGVGDQLAIGNGQSLVAPSPTANAHVVGVFVPAGGDVDGLNLVVMRAQDLASVSGRDTFDRVDVVATPGTPVDQLLDRVAAALPGGTMVVPPSVIGFDAQLRAELEIQRAYHWLLDPDLAHRQQSTDAPTNDAEAAQRQQNWDQNLWQTVNTELRVSRVSFVDNATALVTYRAYYGGQPSSVVREPLTGVVQNVDGQWRVGANGLCDLARRANLTCTPNGGPDASSLVGPPNGWNPVDSVPGVADAFRVLGDPSSTVEQRVAVVENGDALRPVIEAGVKADARRAGQVAFQVVAARLVDPTHAQVLFSVVADGGPHLETPYPLVGNAVLVDGSWRAVSRFACGLSALATLACPAVTAAPTTTSTPPSTTRAVPTTRAPSTTVPATTAATTPPTSGEPATTEPTVTTVTPTTSP